MKKNKLFILIVTIVISVIIIDYYYKINKLKYSGEKLECEVKVGSFYIRYQYIVNDKNYSFKISKSNYSFMIDGEKYNVLYDPNNPSISKLLITEPVINNFEYDKMISLPLDENYQKGANLVSFKYIIGKDTLKRKHKIFLKRALNSKGKKLPIFVHKFNKRISYLNI